jgi:Fe-S cluster assembly protein SufD
MVTGKQYHQWNHKQFVVEGKSVKAYSFDEALEKYGKVLTPFLISLNNYQGDRSGHGLVVVVPDGVCVEQPINISLVSPPSRIVSRVIVVAEPGSKATFIEHTSSSTLHDHDVDVLVQEGAHVQYVTLHVSAQYVSTHRAHVDRGGKIEWFEGWFGDVQATTHSYLKGEGSSAYHYGAFLGHHNEQIDVDVGVTHDAPHTISKLLTHGILDDASKARYTGLITMKDTARGAEGRQQSHTLLLSEDAEVHPHPVLNICHDDVTCSHGATISQLDDEQLMYLMSRGCDEQTSRRMLLEGFMLGVLHTLPQQSVEDVQTLLASTLGGQ